MIIICIKDNDFFFYKDMTVESEINKGEKQKKLLVLKDRPQGIMYYI